MPSNLIHYDMSNFDKYSKQKIKRNESNIPNLAFNNIGKTTRA
jgi:hypothetical protein